MKELEKQKCENCKYLGEIYFPPTNCQNAIHLKACFLYANERRVMYLDTVQSLCEMYKEKIDLTLPES